MFNVSFCEEYMELE